jgi:tRNA (cytidine56-2'-O)-methyltransferase
VSRAFGAQCIYLGSDADASIPKTVEEINGRFGGTFHVEYYTNAEKLIKKLKKEGYCVVHLTMYGEELSHYAKELPQQKKIAIIIGADKVPTAIYHAADYNIQVTGQPHSEVAALAVVLHTIQEGKEDTLEFPQAKIRVKPTAHGKRVEHLDAQ